MNATPIKCLLVDDIEENLVALSALLRRDGLEILTARSGKEALELLLVHDFALAVLDVQMAEMDGIELAELMRGSQRTRNVPIIFVTAGARDPSSLMAGYDSGAVDFLFKPIDPHVLRSKAEVFFELYHQRRELGDALRLAELFVGILGHDLRNPLSAMVMGTQLLERTVTDDTQMKVVRRMASAGRRMENMIAQMLDLTCARLGGGLGLARERTKVDVAEQLQRAADELRGSSERDVRVEHQGECVTFGDGERLLQLFSNLIGNAIAHGDPALPVTITCIREPHAVVVRVHNGGAIPAELLPTIFDPFRGRPGAAPRSGGLGLGLFISRQIALAHGGTLDVDSDEGRGTTFVVRLPRD
ncbi:MAG TPA: hybrid sensor histidine kinase/response regulator [Nannocystaceae bacterium]|nr:hybrid sensor histidine kinase/response regulator [Nannocystaceae bacterium]